MLGKRTLVLCAAVSAMSFGTVAAQATTVVVNQFGDQGWYSSDTRDSSGTNLFGAHDTQPYLLAGNGGAVAGDDAKIAQQISFVNGPGGVGSVKLFATDENAGKANLSVADTTANGFGYGSAMAGSGFFVNYRSYNEPVGTSRTMGISISLTDVNTSASYYTFVYTGTSTPANTWITNSADENSQWYLYGNGVLGAAPGGGIGKSKSLVNWASDSTFGSILSSDYFIYEVGFNLGSYQRDNNTYVDWFQSNLSNNGDVIDFAAVPVPATLPAGLALLGLCGVGLLIHRRRRAA